MIPKQMEVYLKEHLPIGTLENRLIKEEEGRRYVEFRNTDELLLSSLGIVIDKVGPNLVICMWDEESPEDIGGYLVVDNLSMGQPSMGGIRMLPNVTPSDIHNLARGMTLKNAAANLPYGGGKAGIVAERGLPLEQHEKIVRGFARLIKKYREIYIPGPDVGTNDSDMMTIAIENGIDSAVSKPLPMGGNRIDELGGAAGGVVTALQTLIEIMPRLRVLPQFSKLEIPKLEDLTILIQGFGAVGAHTARIFKERIHWVKITGISDLEGYLYNEAGLPVDELYKYWKEKGVVTKNFYIDKILSEGPEYPIKFSTNSNNLLLEDSFCFIPAAPIFNYLGVWKNENPSMTVERMGQWSLIIEGANTYSPDPNRKAARIRMEQIVFKEKGVMIANDYLVNSGGVIFAAQEKIISTPEHLQIPEDMLGNRDIVLSWLEKHKEEFAELSKRRLIAGEENRKKVIHHNMIELVDILAANPDILPCIAAEKISLQRLVAKEQELTAKDIMESLPTIDINSTAQEAAALIISENSGIIAVLEEKKLIGVVTDWDITKAMAENACDVNLNEIMTKNVITAPPDYTIIDLVRKLEQHRISAMPVVKDGKVLGKISSDLITQRYILQNLRES
ncbi:MAG: CBS domain-containing protein [Candidatus Lokiarchaeota archaeon]|nr:CBS domain-containing protein [Candidatus Lokiarchaeota archaeon]